MMPTIRVDDEVWSALQGKAEPLVDTPNSVLRRLLRLDPSHTKSSRRIATPAPRANGSRATRGTILSQSEYREPILKSLSRRGGEAAASDVLHDVYAMVESRLQPADHEKVPSGADIRWRIQAMYQRKKMINDGLLDAKAPFGIWKLSARGKEHAR